MGIRDAITLTGKTRKLVPLQDIRLIARIGRQAVWESVGGDPQFLIDSRAPLLSGIYRITMSVYGQHDRLVRPRLYFDYGNGFSEHESVELDARPAAGGRVAAIFFISRPCRTIRFDPSVEAGFFVLSPSIRFERLNPAQVQLLALQKLLENKPFGRNRDLLKYGWGVYKKEGLGEILRQMRGYGAPPISVSTPPKYDVGILSLNAIGVQDHKAQPSIGVQLHLFYHDLAEEFAECFSRIPAAFSLYVSVRDREGRDRAEAAFSSISNVEHLDIREVPNRGRDIGPLVAEFGPSLLSHDIICHVQSKKSLYNEGATAGWRQYILDSLFRNSEDIKKIFHLLQSRTYGIIYPQCFHNVPYMANTWLANHGIARAWQARFGLREIPSGYFDFPVGSMFWARSDALSPILSSGITWQDFPDESGQTDGTLAHCIERMLGVVPSSKGFALGILSDDRHPSWSKWRFEQFTNRPVEHLTRRITDPAIKVVAFDIFDTLLTRPFVDPDFVKEILHAEALQLGFSGFKQLRASSESDLRERIGRDVGIHEIYDEMRAKAADLPVTADREIELEVVSVRKRAPVFELLKLAKESHKRIILASDMFLPRTAIQRMLAGAGIEGWQQLYLSSEIGLRKDRGDLYHHILKEEGVKVEQVLMIGDNERSDFQIPTDMGIKSLHLLAPVSFMRGLSPIAKRIPQPDVLTPSSQVLFGLLAHKLFIGTSYPDFRSFGVFGSSAYEVGYSVVGPLLTSFSDWLLKKSRAGNVARLHFLAREGKLLKAGFDVWSAGIEGAPESNYLVVSRRAVSVPAIRTMDDILSLASSNNFYENNFEIFLSERYGLEVSDQTKRELVEAGVVPPNGMVSVYDGDVTGVRKLLDHLAPKIYANAEAEFKDMSNYLLEAGLSGDSRQALVDVGYSGTIQKFIMKLLSRKIDGFYLATEEKASSIEAEANVTIDACFAKNVKKSTNAPAIFLHSFLLEKLLSADDAQILKYQNGKPVFRALRQQEQASRPVRQEVQEGALEFVRDARRLRHEMMSDLNLLPADAVLPFEMFATEFHDEAKEFLSRIALDDDYCGRGVVS